jgi:hypothetical protein
MIGAEELELGARLGFRGSQLLPDNPTMRFILVAQQAREIGSLTQYLKAGAKHPARGSLTKFPRPRLSKDPSLN